MSQKNRAFIKWVRKVINSKSFSWLAPFSIILVGAGVVFAIRAKPLIAILLVSIIALVLATYIAIFVYIERNQISRSASFNEFPKPEYITLDTRLLWIIENENGTKARLDKTKKIQALIPLTVVKEFWWGDGAQPDQQDYLLSGAAREIARKFRQGSKWVIDVVLDRQYAQDEILELSYIRKLRDSFTSDSEWVETVIATETESLNLSVIFPNERQFKSAKAVTSFGDSSKEYPLKAVEDTQGQLLRGLTEDGKMMLSWTVRKPVLGSTYTIEWDW